MDTVPVRDMSPRSPRLGTPDSGWDDDDDLDLGLGNKIYSLKKLELVFFINQRRNSKMVSSSKCPIDVHYTTLQSVALVNSTNIKFKIHLRQSNLLFWTQPLHC